MNIKNFIGALAIAAAGVFATGTASIAAVDDITDSDGDSTSAFALSNAALGAGVVGITLSNGGAVTGGFDSTSDRFTFEGTGSSAETFTIASTVPVVVSFGTLTLPGDFDVAEITVNGTVIDLLTNPATFIGAGVSNPFDLVTNFVANKANGQFDFTITTIPLPAGLALLLGGLGILGWVGRRRQTIAA